MLDYHETPARETPECIELGCLREMKVPRGSFSCIYMYTPIGGINFRGLISKYARNWLINYRLDREFFLHGGIPNFSFSPAVCSLDTSRTKKSYFRRVCMNA